MVWHSLPDFKLYCCTIRKVHRVAHESSPHCHLAGWVKLTSHITQHQARLPNTLNKFASVTTCMVADLCRWWSQCYRSYRVAKQYQLDTWDCRSWLHLWLSNTPDLAWWFWGFNTAHRHYCWWYQQHKCLPACCAPGLLLLQPMLQGLVRRGWGYMTAY